jgi:hypothetical protein
MSGLNHDKLCCATIHVKKEAVNCCISFIHDEKGAMVFYDLHNMMVLAIAMRELKALLPNRPRIIENVVQKTACLSL